jgi:hypothetical protein
VTVPEQGNNESTHSLPSATALRAESRRFRGQFSHWTRVTIRTNGAQVWTICTRPRRSRGVGTTKTPLEGDLRLGLPDRADERFHRRIGETAVMAFGQQTGPPASSRQVQELLTLLHEAGHTDFRDARGPLGFTQRQAGGKFTRDEAEAFIGRLQDAVTDGSAPVAAERPPRLSAQEQAMRRIPAEELAAELQRRGWTVTEP